MIKKLPYMGPLEKYEYRITENPIEEIWHLIDLATSKEIILEKSSSPVSKDVVPFITESIVQAEEFKSSAAVCTEHTKPLQLYYCFHNLTKAILVLENNSVSSGYHGLKKVEIPSSGDFLGVSAQLDEGVFWDLLLLEGITPKRCLQITFDGLLNRCVYMTWEYEMAYNMKSMVLLPGLECNHSFTELKVKTQAPLGDFLAKWEELLPSFAKYFELKESTSDHLIFSLRAGAPRGNLDAIQSVLDQTVIYSVFTSPNYFLLPITNVEYSWSQEAYFYALSFILSSLVRYYPDYWHREVLAKRRNRWIVRRLNYVMERVYPNLMLNIMFSGRIKFGGSF